LLAVFGWLATHLFSEARERRKEVRERLDKLVERIVGLEDDARAFHSAAEYDEHAANAILYELDRLERSATRVQALNIDALVPMLIHHRRAITLQNFDASSFKTQAGSSEIFADIASASADFEDELERQYGVRYPSRFPYFTTMEFARSPAR